MILSMLVVVVRYDGAGGVDCRGQKLYTKYVACRDCRGQGASGK